MAFSIPFNVNPWQLILVMILGYFTLVGLGLAGGGVLLVTKKGDPVTWLLTTFTTLFSGVLYPVEILPQWLQSISWYVPTTRILSSLRGH
ncbi:ABC transporter permease [Bifidobacterium breve]|nr:ABC transporter permease [Bifidobacterium breve]MBK5056320.1 ABC transporter permease [Bifidobacterium breve]